MQKSSNKKSLFQIKKKDKIDNRIKQLRLNHIVFINSTEIKQLTFDSLHSREFMMSSKDDLVKIELNIWHDIENMPNVGQCMTFINTLFLNC